MSYQQIKGKEKKITAL